MTERNSLRSFDPILEYPAYNGMIPISAEIHHTQMDEISYLIMYMSIYGANSDEILRAVRHSMVIIDAEKHNLDYKKSAKDHGIAQLITKYQGA